MPDKPWKAFEREVAKKMGGVRMGPTGRMTNDVDHEHFAIECKYRKAIPGFLLAGIKQAEINSSSPNKTPILFLKKPRSNLKDDMVVMRASDFYDWFGVKPTKVNDTGHDEE